LLRKAQDEGIIEFIISNDDFAIELREEGIEEFSLSEIMRMEF
jgi:hypothetical protein